MNSHTMTSDLNSPKISQFALQLRPAKAEVKKYIIKARIQVGTCVLCAFWRSSYHY